MKYGIIVILSLFLTACGNPVPSQKVVEQKLARFIDIQTGKISVVSIHSAKIEPSSVRGFATARIAVRISAGGISNDFDAVVNLKKVGDEWTVINFKSRDLQL